MKKITFILIVFLLFIISSCSYNRYQDENFQYYKMKVSNEYVYAVTGLTEIGKSKNVLVFPNEYNGLKTYIKNSNLGPGSGKINSSNLKLFLPKEFTYVREDYFRFIYDEKNVNETSKLIILSNDLENLNLNEVKYLKNIFVSNQIYKLMNNSNYSFNRANVSYNYNYNDSPNGGYYWIDDYDGEVISFVPPTPSRDGYTFMGWYKESECINEWNFNEDIVPSKEFIEKEYIYNETTLYAKWKVNNIENDEISSHEHLICDECGKCLDIKCNGEESDKCFGHYTELFFTPSKESMKNFNIISDWLNSKYNEINEPYYDAYVKYENFYNILPNDYAKQKNIYLIETYSPNAYKLKESKTLFIWNNGEIKELYNGNIEEIVHIAIIDSNKDEYEEILISYNQSNIHSYIIIYDSKSNNFLISDYYFDEENQNYLFFKQNNNELSIVYNNVNNYYTANSLYKKIIKNEYEYTFYEQKLFIEGFDWDISIVLDEGSINFPIYIEDTKLYFYAKTILLYKGELYDYGYYQENRLGANLCFINNERTKFLCRKWYNSDGIYHPNNILTNGEIIVETYYYEQNVGDNVLGDYYLDVGFGLAIHNQLIYKCLNVSQKILEEN